MSKKEKLTPFMLEKATEEVLKFDPLHESDKKYGKNTEESNALGFFLLHAKSKAARKLLQAQDDTYHNQPASEYLRVIQELGFEKVLQIPFTKDGTERNYYIFWDSRGLLLSFDTYRWSGKEETINGGNIYFNWQRNKNEKSWPDNFSGGVHRDSPDDSLIFVGHMDCREAVAHKINKMSRSGKFLTQWVEQPFLYLVHHGEESGRFEKANKEKISQLPETIRKSIDVWSPWNSLKKS